MSDSAEEPILSLDLLQLLRCPVAVRDKSLGEDPGRLELVHNCWLVCDRLGYEISDS